MARSGATKSRKSNGGLLRLLLYIIDVSFRSLSHLVSGISKNIVIVSMRSESDMTLLG